MNIFHAYSHAAPTIGADEILEIENLKVTHIGGGVVRFSNVVNIDFPRVSQWIDENGKTSHEQRWTYGIDEIGERYAINEDGNKFSIEHQNEVPVRVLAPVTENTDEDMITIFKSWEDSIYKCLIRYIDEYPLIVNTLWWRSRGHILRYSPGHFLGVHNDNDSNYRATEGKRYVPKGQMQMRQVIAVMLYINDGVDSKEKLDGTNFVGGELYFPYLGIESVPHRGDIVIFPTNYIASHGVKTVTDGIRYAYLEFYSQGNSDESVCINVAELDDCEDWCRPHWMDTIYDDYHKYCASGNYDKSGQSYNPAFQNRPLEGDEGHRQSLKLAQEKLLSQQ